MSRISTLFRGAGWAGAALAGFAACADYPVKITNPTSQPWRLVCTKPFLPLRVITQDGAGGVVVKQYKAFQHPLLAPLTPEFKNYLFEFVIPGKTTAMLETTGPADRGRAEFLLVDHRGRELDDSHAVRETVCYWVAPDESSSRRDAWGRPLAVGRICYDHRAPAGVLAGAVGSANALVFTAEAWGGSGTRAFPGLESAQGGEPEPKEDKQPAAEAAKAPGRSSRTAGALVPVDMNPRSAGPGTVPAKARLQAPKLQKNKSSMKNQENVAP